jgi:hypothetical protein
VKQSGMRFRLACAGLAAICLGLSSALAAQSYFGEEGGFEVVLNQHGACEASKGVYYRDGEGVQHYAAMSFGLTIEQEHLLSMLGVYSRSFALPAGESRSGSVGFDGAQRDATYVADSQEMLSAYMTPDQIRDIARAQNAELRLFDGRRVVLPLTGTFAASRLIADCYMAHLAGRTNAPNPFVAR